mmetsp:Transcript_16110/g.66423  ORF Transcript_16110/g.66423 Transcript_16110/m.66423 type:complete len:157 (+) Transcript_16110:65-535(+)
MAQISSCSPNLKEVHGLCQGCPTNHFESALISACERENEDVLENLLVKFISDFTPNPICGPRPPEGALNQAQSVLQKLHRFPKLTRKVVGKDAVRRPVSRHEHHKDQPHLAITQKCSGTLQGLRRSCLRSGQVPINNAISVRYEIIPEPIDNASND